MQGWRPLATPRLAPGFAQSDGFAPAKQRVVLFALLPKIPRVPVFCSLHCRCKHCKLQAGQKTQQRRTDQIDSYFNNTLSSLFISSSTRRRFVTSATFWTSHGPRCHSSPTAPLRAFICVAHRVHNSRCSSICVEFLFVRSGYFGANDVR